MYEKHKPTNAFLISHIKNVKFTLVQALRPCTGHRARRGSRGIALHFHDHGTRRGWGVSVTPKPIFTPGKTRYLLYRRLGGPQGRSGQVRKISPPPAFDPRTFQPVASRYTDWATRPTYFPYSDYKKLRHYMEIKYYIAFSNEIHFVRPAWKLTNIQSVSLKFHAAVWCCLAGRPELSNGDTVFIFKGQ